MAEPIKVWYDPEADYLEVLFHNRAGSFRETSSDQVMAKVDESGEVIGFSILKVGTLKGRPLELSLAGPA
jgi:uncharacterized protein YuzE